MAERLNDCINERSNLVLEQLSIASFMGYLKGKSTLMIYDRQPELQSKWDKAFWARGYYVETIGNITDEAVQKYIKKQAVTQPFEGLIINHQLNWWLLTCG